MYSSKHMQMKGGRKSCKGGKSRMGRKCRKGGKGKTRKSRGGMIKHYIKDNEVLGMSTHM